MKVFGIGDLLIPEQYIKKGFSLFEEAGHEVTTLQWPLKDMEELQNINREVEKFGSEGYDPPEEILAAIEDTDILITQFFPVGKKVIDRCRNLKVVGVLRAGYENINVPYLTEKGILFFNTPGRNSNAVADFAVGMILSESRNIARAHKNLKEGIWDRIGFANDDAIPELAGKTAGIIGFGMIGRKVAKRLHGFDMEIVAYDPYVTEVPDYVELVSLDDLLKRSMFVTIHGRLSEDTKHMINAEKLALMRPDAYLINTARSALVDEKALYEALKNKKIMGAALDVFDTEPPGIDYPLVTLPNVTITPHLAGSTIDAFTNSPKLIAEEMIHIFDKKLSRFVVNKELWESATSKF